MLFLYKRANKCKVDPHPIHLHLSFNMENALVRVPLVIANSIGVYMSYNPPSFPADTKELDKYKDRKETKDTLTPIAWAVVPLLRVGLTGVS